MKLMTLTFSIHTRMIVRSDFYTIFKGMIRENLPVNGKWRLQGIKFLILFQRADSMGQDKL